MYNLVKFPNCKFLFTVNVSIFSQKLPHFEQRMKVLDEEYGLHKSALAHQQLLS